MQSAWLWARIDLRRRWPSIVIVALVVAIVLGASLALIAGARRAAAALDRLAEATDAPEVLVTTQADPPPEFVASLEDDPRVTGVDRATLVTIAPAPMDVGESGFTIIGTPDSLTGGFGRPLILAGRYPEPSSTDEIMINERAADDFGFEAGQRVPLRAISCYIDCPPETIGEATIVGIVRLPTDIIRDPSVPGIAIASPNLLDGRWRELPAPAGWFGLHVRDRADTDSLVSDLSVRIDDGDVASTMAALDVVRRAGRLQRTALLVAAAVVGFAGLLVVAMVLARHLTGRSEDPPVLAALGLRPGERRLAGMLSILPALAGGLAGGVALAIAASSLMPLGLPGRADPDVGVQADTTVLLIGGAVTVALLLGVAVLVAYRWATPAPVATPPGQPSVATRMAAALGLRPVPATGVAFALERGQGRVRLPVTATLVVLAGTTAIVVGALVVRSSLDGLIATPDRYGEAWDLSVAMRGDDPRGDAKNLVDDPRVLDVAVSRQGEINLASDDGRTYQVATTGIDSLAGALPLSVLAGRTPSGPREIALASETMRTLGMHIGEHVMVSGPCGDFDSEVVGKVIVPFTGSNYPDAGSILTLEAYDEVCANELLGDLDVNDRALVRLRDAASTAAVRAGWEAEGLTVHDRTAPVSIVLVNDIRVVPLLVAGLVAILGIAAAAHALLLTVGRRRHDLAVLQAMGLRPHQASGIVGWHAATLAAVAVVVGVPLGVVLGRLVWTALANTARVVVYVDVDLRGLGLVVAVVVGVAAILAFWPARRAARLRTAEALRSE